jgi:PAS domain S-box-containing protein
MGHEMRPVVAYAVAVLALVAAILLRWLIEPVLLGKLPFVTLFGAVAVAVWLGGYAVAVLVTVLGYAACQYLFIAPWGRFDELQNLLGLAAYVFTCSIIIVFGEVMRRAQGRAREEHEKLRVTFASIGDAVITTDAEGRITSVNPVAESVTGWTDAEAAGQLVEHVFRIVNEQTREPAPSPVTRVLQEGGIAGLANHTVLIRKDGSEVPIDDSAAPIRNETGRLIGCVLVFRDITKRRQAEKEVWSSRELLRTTLASIGDAVMTTDAAGRVTYLNAVAESVTGWTDAEAAGQLLENVFRIVNEHTRKTVESPTTRAIRDGVIVGLANHTVLICKDGSELPIDDSAAPIRTQTGELVGCVLVFRDITKRRQAEAEREELLAITEHARAQTEATLTVLRRVESITEAALIDLPFDDMLRELVRRVSEALSSDTATLLLEEDGVLRVRAAVGLEDEVRTRVKVPIGAGFAGHIAQERRPHILNDVHYSELVSAYFHDKGIHALVGVPLLSGQGTVLGVLHVGSVRPGAFGDEDVRVLQLAAERVALAVEHAARLASEHRARAAAERTATMMRRVQRIADAMLAQLPLDDLLHEVLVRVQEALEADVAVMLMSRWEEEGGEEELRVRAVVGVTDDIEIGLAVPPGRGFCGAVVKARDAVVWNEIANEQLVLAFLRKKGVQALVGVPLLSGGHLLGVLQVGSVERRQFQFEDVELLKRAAERIALGIERSARIDAERRVRETLEASNRTKDEFLAMLGHELRNPLSAVRNAVATATRDESRRPRALEIAERQAEQLGRLIDDLLDVARITQGRITLRKERVHLNEIIEHAMESTRSLIESRGLELSIAIAPEPIRVDADPARLQQVLVNLLSNAAKYTEPGGRIDLTSERRGDEVVVRIRDTGIGIAPEMLPRIWDLFTQSDRALDRAQGGLGIGLTVARRLVELHGGRIEAFSEGLGAGAEFVVTLPALPAASEEVRPPVPPEPVPRRTARVLVVEDNRDAAESLLMLLELLGHRVRAVYDGVTALDAARANTPDVMLIDIGLPDMDGYEIARRVRRDPDLKQVVLVALTGYGREEDKQQAMAAGFDYHLVKPVSPDALHGLVTRLTKEGEPLTVH